MDEKLIRQVQNGRIEAFNQLVKRWELPLYNFVLRYIGHRDEAKDICQVSFIRIYQHIKTLRDPGKFSTWAYRITLNVCRDELRRRQRKPTLRLNGSAHGDDAAAPEIGSVSQEGNPEMAIQQQNLATILNAALQNIPEDQRIVIIMKEYQGLKFHEIADVLNISENTAKSRMYYGLRALKKLLQGWGIDQEKLIYER